MVMKIKLLLLLALLIVVGGVFGFYYLTRAPQTTVTKPNTTVQNVPLDTSPAEEPISPTSESSVEAEIDALENLEFGTGVGDL